MSNCINLGVWETGVLENKLPSLGTPLCCKGEVMLCCFLGIKKIVEKIIEKHFDLAAITILSTPPILFITPNYRIPRKHKRVLGA